MKFHWSQIRIIFKIFAVILTALALIFSCTTKEGVITSFAIGTGGLIVNSSINGAHIFLDHRDAGQKTPALIQNVPQGMHVIHVFLGGHRIVQDSILVQITEGADTSIDFDLIETPSVGDLAVNTTPDCALVFIDTLPIGRTPLTVIGLLEGTHSLKIIRGGYSTTEQSFNIQTNQQTNIEHSLHLENQLTLVEHFSNTDCAPCPQADEIIESVLEEKGVDSVAVISYHPDFPGRQDPFFLAAEEANLMRYEFYSRPPLPFAVVDGLNRMAGTVNLETRFREALLNRLGKQPAATLDFLDLLEFWQGPDAISGRIRVDALQDLPGSKVTLHIALIEREVSFSVAPGSNGQKHFFDVMRAFLPSSAGYAVGLSKGQYQVFDFRFEPQPDWTGDLQVVVFLQNRATREVLQSIWSAR